MQEARNCEGLYPRTDNLSKFRFQFLNNEIIYECPMSYFSNDIKAIYAQYNNYKLMKEMGILVDSKDISLIELQYYHIIEIELGNAHDEKSKREAKRQPKKAKVKR